MTKISKYDLCPLCSQIRMLPDCTCEEWLDSERYNQSVEIIHFGMNLVLLGHLETKGGCKNV